MTYSTACEIIRNVCTPCTFTEIKKANKELKKHLDLVEIRKVEDALSTVVWYGVCCDNAVHYIGYDFWNGRLV